MNKYFLKLEEMVLNHEKLTKEDALGILKTEDSLFWDLIASSNRVRSHFKGNKISLCAIVNARSGMCAENCAFCAQSVHSSSQVPEYGLLGKKDIVDSAKSAVKEGASKFGIVTSGRGISKEGDASRVKKLIQALKEDVPVHRCASLGILSLEELKELKETGLKEYHHNLETCRSFFPSICTTHAYDDNKETILAAKKAGLRVCAGGIFGMGETLEQRVEFALELRDLEVDSIPVNFLNPISGTRLESLPPLKPMDGLRILAMLRFMMPEIDIKMAGGREAVLGDLQSLMFAAGANSTMLGNYLTTEGRSADRDLRMIDDLGLSRVESE